MVAGLEMDQRELHQRLDPRGGRALGAERRRAVDRVLGQAARLVEVAGRAQDVDARELGGEAIRAAAVRGQRERALGQGVLAELLGGAGLRQRAVRDPEGLTRARAVEHQARRVGERQARVAHALGQSLYPARVQAIGEPVGHGDRAIGLVERQVRLRHQPADGLVAGGVEHRGAAPRGVAPAAGVDVGLAVGGRGLPGGPARRTRP